MSNLKVSSVVAEFNPFHSGHKYLIDRIRENGASHICCVMSGNFVQRGECSIYSKWDRTKTALENGIDLVLELPTVYAVSTAQRFAYASTSILEALGCVDELSFGSECGDINKLKELSVCIADKNVDSLIKEYLKSGETYAVSRMKAVEKIFGEDLANELKMPNNILAVEYINNLSKNNIIKDYFTTERVGSGYNETENRDHPSASALRKIVSENKKSCDTLFEEYRGNFEKYSFKKLEIPVLSKLRTMSREDFLLLPDVSEGLENRIAESVNSATSLDELYGLIKTKRYTHSRIRRIILNAFLDIKKTDVEIPVPYIKVLGFNEKGKDILRTARKTAALPIIMKSSDITYLNDDAKRIYEIECRCTDLFSLAGEKVHPCGLEKTMNIIK